MAKKLRPTKHHVRPDDSGAFDEGGFGSLDADSNLFHQGAARQSEDPDVIAATMAVPGVVLKRPVGSNGPFKEQAEQPTDLAGERGSKKSGRKSRGRKAQKPSRRGNEEVADRKAALASRRSTIAARASARRKKLPLEKERERRQHAIDEAQGALDAGRRKREEKVAHIRAELEALEDEPQAG